MIEMLAMSRWYSGAAALLLLLPPSLAGQNSEFSRFELYGGYAHWTSGRMTPRGLAGFGLAISYAPKPWLRWVLFDAGGSFGNTPLTQNVGKDPLLPSAVHQENIQVLTGPELTKRTLRFTVFMHGLFGYYIWGTTYIRGNTLNDERGIAVGTGGGVDINLSHFLALRAGLDYIPSRISQSGPVTGDLPVPSSPQANWYNNLRVSFGLILKSNPR
jgi:hypothetical protein